MKCLGAGYGYISAPIRDINEISKAMPCFQVQAMRQSNEINRNAVWPNRKWQVQDSGLKTGSTHISAGRHDGKKITPTSPQRNSIPVE